MTGRVVDATRQGGGNAAPKTVQGAAAMSVGEALAYRESVAWRQFRPRADRAVEALADEVLRLRAEAERAVRTIAGACEESEQAQAELARIRAALPDIIGCSLQPPQCPHDAYGWAHCCRVRLACVAHGLLPAVERATEEEDGA